MLKISRFFTLILFVIFQPYVYSQDIKLKFVETSDVHGALLPFNFIADKPANASLAQVMTYLKQERADKDQYVVYVDNGDFLQGTPLVYYYNYIKTGPAHLFADAYNYMGCDVATPGNHDVETGHAVYDKIRDELDFPWLAANAINLTTSEPYFKPYHMLERGGASIAVLGLITPLIPEWLPEKLYAGMAFDDMIETAEKWVKIIREKENPDLLIGLFHSGVDYTYGGTNANTKRNENAASLVAKKVAGFDVVFVGHDHKGWNYTVKDPDGRDVLILGTTSGARNMAVADLTLAFDENENRLVKKDAKGALIETRNFLPDPDFMLRYEENMKEVRDYLSRPIARFSETICSNEALFGPSKFVDLLHSFQLEQTGADVSFSAPLSFNACINEGVIHMRDMFDLYSFENLLYTIRLSGSEIKNYLEYSSAIWFNEMKSDKDNLLKFRRDNEGNIMYSERTRSAELDDRFYNFESAAGINYIVDVSKPSGQRVEISSFSDGRNFDLAASYTVAINSYRANGGGGHLIDGAKIPQDELPSRILTSTEFDLRFYLMQWLEKKQQINPQILNNWQIIPKAFWEAGKQRDFDILFKKK